MSLSAHARRVLEIALADAQVCAEIETILNEVADDTSTGTNAATYQVDADSGKPRAGLKSQTGGTGNFVAYYQAPSTLTANRTYTGPADADDTLVGIAATQTLTNKTLTSPVLTTPQINDASADHQYVFAGGELAADRTVSLPVLTAGDTFVFLACAQTLSNKTVSDALLFTAGAAANAVAQRFGKTSTEGLEVRVIDEVVTLTNAVEVNLTETVPSGAVILSVQGNLDSAVTGDASGDNGLTKVGIGVTADPDKYGKSADLNKNTKIDFIPDWAVLSGAETVCVKAADNDGAAVTEKFTAGGTVRVRVVYLANNSLDNHA